MRLVFPAETAGPVDDTGLERLYRYPDPHWLAVCFVSSADGAVTITGHSQALSTPPDRVVYQLCVDLADVILLGAGTAVNEGFTGERPDERSAERRRRHGLAPVPPIAVVSSGGSLPPEAPVLTEPLVPTIVLTAAAAPAGRRAGWAAAGAEVVVVGRDRVDPAAAVAALRERGLGRINAQGGPLLFGQLIAAGLVDELRLTIAPMLVAGAAGRIASGPEVDPAELRLASVLEEDSTLLLRYLRP